MSSILKDRMKQEKQEKADISRKVEQEHIKPTEDEQEKAMRVIQAVSERFSGEIVKGNIDDLSDDITKAVADECVKLDISFEDQKRIEKTVRQTALGNGPIEEYLEDPEVTEIVVQRYDSIVIERNGRIEEVTATFNNERHLQTIIERIVQRAGRQINIATPIVDARLKDGSRVNATIPPVSPDGATLTIRKFNNQALFSQDYLRLGSLDKRMLYFLAKCVRGKVNIFISGGTGTGKTTMLNMLSHFIPEDELIVSIEDTLELKLQQRNVRRMEVRPSTSKDMMEVTQKTLVKAALRQRPDRIILGETRDGSVVDLISAMSTGHEGAMSTIHANSPKNMCDVRIPILYSMNKDANFSEKSIAMQVAEAIQLIIQISRMPDGSRKISEIAEVAGVTADGKVKTATIFFYDKKDQTFKWTGYRPRMILQKIERNGEEFDDVIFSGVKDTGTPDVESGEM